MSHQHAILYGLVRNLKQLAQHQRCRRCELASIDCLLEAYKCLVQIDDCCGGGGDSEPCTAEQTCDEISADDVTETAPCVDLAPNATCDDGDDDVRGDEDEPHNIERDDNDDREECDDDDDDATDSPCWTYRRRRHRVTGNDDAQSDHCDTDSRRCEATATDAIAYADDDSCSESSVEWQTRRRRRARCSDRKE
jgi:hypothetical protein